MRYLILSVCACLTLSACDQTQLPNEPSVSLNFDYASTSLGFRNSGALAAGRLLLWDTADNSLVDIESEIELPVSNQSPPVTLEATNVNGVEVSASGDIPRAAKVEIGANASRQLAFRADDAIRVSNSGIFTALSDAYLELKNSGVDAFRAWRVADATENSTRYKYVVLVEPVLAAEESMVLKNETGGSASLAVFQKGVGDVNVKVPNNATANCKAQQGERAVCYVNARVLTAFLNDNGNLDYEPSGYSRADLAEAFRNQ